MGDAGYGLRRCPAGVGEGVPAILDIDLFLPLGFHESGDGGLFRLCRFGRLDPGAVSGVFLFAELQPRSCVISPEVQVAAAAFRRVGRSIGSRDVGGGSAKGLRRTPEFSGAEYRAAISGAG